jgi:hypothetical protein
MKSTVAFACSIIAIAFTATASARAGEIPIDISAYANVPWTYQLTNGSGFPTGNLNYGGVPYSVPTGPNNWWSANYAANGGAGTVSVTIPVGVAGVTSAFTWLNTENGQPGPTAYLYVTFHWSGGSATAPLIGDVNVRDYNNYVVNTINDTSTVQVWSNGLGQRLDRQEYIIPPSLSSQVLESVTITDTGNYGFSRAIFSALTVSTCPAYVAEGITISSSKIVYDPSKSVYLQEVTLTNTGTAAVKGPLLFILEDLPSGVTLVNKSAATACFAPIGSRFVEALPEGSSLAPNTTVVLKLGFSDPSGAAISYTPLAAGSLGGAP